MFLGIDAGGSKTHALIVDAEGNVVGGGVSGPGNWEVVGLDGVCDAYAQAIAMALHHAGIERHDLRAAGYALAGLDWESQLPNPQRIGLVLPDLVASVDPPT